ncbi:MAG: ABC transporter ATP-binding protein [Propionibacteriaceae bacterium]|nr:ABC transporter ATP-binding protein [Propionibacteriaceae bacterium]
MSPAHAPVPLRAASPVRAASPAWAATPQKTVAPPPSTVPPPIRMGTAPIAQAVNVVKVYGKGDTAVTALDGLSVDFQPGTFTAIMGPSGSGKSTLMHCLAGLDRVTSGEVILDGQDITKLSDRKLTAVRRDQVGFVFQQFNLLPTLTALQNILLPLDLAGRRADQALLDQVIDSLDLRDRLKHLPSELSGGQQQRVAVARALITSPKVVFADEPTGALDSRNSAALLGYLRRCTDQLHQTIIMVTHDATAATYSDRALILSDGRITQDLARPDVDTVLRAIRG